MTQRIDVDSVGGDPVRQSRMTSSVVITPADYLSYLRRIGQLSDFRAPPAVILCYQRALLQRILAEEDTTLADPETCYRSMVTIARTGHRVGVVGAFGYGAIAAVSVLEELIALGATRFITIGTAGALQDSCEIGDILVCDRAVRDDGISQHYLPPERYAAASPQLTGMVSGTLSSRGVAHRLGATWTTGALYRETHSQVADYRKQGVVGVEMEAAALFAVGEFRSVSVGALAVIADAVLARPWHPAWDSPQVLAALVTGYQACVETLSPSDPS